VARLVGGALLKQIVRNPHLEGLELKTTRRVPRRDHIARVQRLARERAEFQARRIPWQRLLETRNAYVGWQEFYLWVRSVVEVENRIPEWIADIVNQRCPAFLENEKRLTMKAAKNRPLPLRLEDWIDDHIFGFAKQEGWFNAITYYAIREPRYQRAEVCWSECVKNWKKARPLRYPSFEEWKLMAERCDPTAHLVPELRKRMASIRSVDPVRFAEATSRYIDWEALAYWARPALERGSELPKAILDELQERSPEFLDTGPDRRDWRRFMSWISEHCFCDAKKEGWLDSLVLRAADHPRAIRTREYAHHCDEAWGSRLPDPYPSFQEWRGNADSFVEPTVLPAGLNS
jgi:hypothetical protein